MKNKYTEVISYLSDSKLITFSERQILLVRAMPPWMFMVKMGLAAIVTLSTLFLWTNWWLDKDSAIVLSIIVFAPVGIAVSAAACHRQWHRHKSFGEELVARFFALKEKVDAEVRRSDEQCNSNAKLSDWDWTVGNPAELARLAFVILECSREGAWFERQELKRLHGEIPKKDRPPFKLIFAAAQLRVLTEKHFLYR